MPTQDAQSVDTVANNLATEAPHSEPQQDRAPMDPQTLLNDRSADPSDHLDVGPDGGESTQAHVLRELPPTRGAQDIVRKHMHWAAGFGIIPFPLVDFVTTSAVSLKMIRDLARYYGVKFDKTLAKTAAASLMSGVASPLLAVSVGSFIKSIPIVGSTIGAVTSPIAAGIFTYATGQVFILHFGSGGTLFDFDPEKFRDYFQNQVKAGKAT